MTRLAAKLQTHFIVLKERWDAGERGATAVEYGLLVALIAAVIVVVVKSVGTKVNAGFTTVDGQLP
jgi:pilus assembly protein Flp/PilA